MRHLRFTALLTAGLLVLGACGGDDDTTADNGDAAESVADEQAFGDGETQDDVATDDPPSPAGDSGAGSTGEGGGTASLTLANGESFEFSILCMLEPQTAAGSEILFTVVSYDDTGLDITQFGDEGTITESANITVYDSSFETLWDAGTLYETFGGTIDLSLDGSTVTGTGSFYPSGDIQGVPVDGEVVANC